MAELSNRYVPRRVSPPGGTLQDVLDERGMAQNELADRTGLTTKAINEIVKGKSALTPSTALKLERALGIPAGFWLNREQQYQEYVARERAEAEQASAVAWLANIPVRELVRLRVVRNLKAGAELVGECLRFFGVASPAAWQEVYAVPQVAFRRSSAFECDAGATAAWLRLGELQAQNTRTEPYDAERFRGVLERCVRLTRRPFQEVATELRDACASAGVALVYVPEVRGCRASGVTRWISPTKALMQLSGRYKTEDHLWFTFFHEAGHILLHQKKAVFLDAGGGGSAEEREADRFARDALIPASEFAAFSAQVRGPVTSSVVRAFAERAGVDAGIVVGRLQHEKKLPYQALNDLKRKLEFTWAPPGSER